MAKFDINFSDKQDQFETGAVRGSSEGKVRYDLISVWFKHRLAVRLTDGAKGYGVRNWEKGMPVSRVVESLERHLAQYLMGDRTEDHLAALAFNVMQIIHYEEMVDQGKLPSSLLDMEDIYGENLADTGQGD